MMRQNRALRKYLYLVRILREVSGAFFSLQIKRLDNHESLPERASCFFDPKGVSAINYGGQMELSGNFEREWETDYERQRSFDDRDSLEIACMHQGYTCRACPRRSARPNERTQ